MDAKRSLDFGYFPDIRDDFPELVSGAILIEGLGGPGEAAPLVEKHTQAALRRIGASSESDLLEIQAWRRTFSRMGLKPTQYRCASEALLRRLRKEGALPSLNPVVDFCNAISMAYAIPIAAFDPIKISGALRVRRSEGNETYAAFSGATETPDAGEVIFADDARQAHARRWANRQSAASAIGPGTTSALIVAEAFHAGADADISRLLSDVEVGAKEIWGARVVARIAF
jgi:DNA/RNA-binding domain of Phe-tRNA-synthetase-like protein